ncbi:MAG: hypothetical protein IJM15_06115 [Erysipelotrichaceae bacterium]|nr:hypothetical protein [Erysipelotrichaceae bacterium]
MKNARSIYELIRNLRDQPKYYQREIADSYFRLSEDGNWRLIKELFGIEKKGR